MSAGDGNGTPRQWNAQTTRSRSRARVGHEPQPRPRRVEQRLAGHSDLKTTQRYMHLTPAALEGAIRLLEQPSPLLAGPAGDRGRGDIVETV